MACGLFVAHRMPSDTSCRRWFNQVGYYKLTKTKDVAEDWIYFIDNSIRQENRKVCLILGLRASKLKKGQYLCFEDLEPIELRLIQKNQALEGIINDAIKKTGVPFQICSDEGPDIMPSIRKVIANNPKIKFTPDIMHKVGNLLKEKLEEDKRWKKFVTNVNKSKNSLKQSSLSFLCPPNFRGKSRFMNCSNVVDCVDALIDIVEKMEKTDPNYPVAHEKLGWVIKSKKDIALFKELFCLGRIAKEIVRKLHIEKGGAEVAEVLLNENAHHEEGMLFAKVLIDFIKQQCEKGEENKLMVGSSEVIESALGKLKTLDRECGNSGFTHSIIGLAACFGSSDFETLKNAFTECTHKDVLIWSEKNVGETHQTKRRKFFNKKNRNLVSEIERILERKSKVTLP